MSGKNLIFQSKENKTRKAAADILRQMAEKIESGTIKLIQNNEETVIDLPENLNFKIKAKTKDKKMAIKKQIEIEIEWKENDLSNIEFEIK